jgi:diguanylate cyclase (GGDEF)-like protein/PAS domain S-box-containing protein
MNLLLRETDSTEPLYRLILDNALDSFIAIDNDSKIIEWSKQAEKTFGWTRDEAIGAALTDTIIPERYRAAHLAGLRRYLETGENRILNQCIELYALRKDGGEIPVELTVAPLALDGTTIFSATLRDISRSKELEEVVQHQANITRSILDSMADAVVVADLSERLILVNPAAQRLLNLDPVEARFNQSFRVFAIYQPDRKTLCPDSERPLAKALRGEQVDGMIGFLRPEGRAEGAYVSANARPLADRSGALIGAVVVFHDITESREREDALARQALALRQSQENYRLLVESSTEYAMIMLDPAGIILSWSAGAEIILGLSAEEAIGQPISALFTSEDKQMGEPMRELEEAKATGRSDDNRWHIRRDGSRFWADGVVTPLWNADGSLRGFVKIMRDQTMHRLAEEQTQFLANHDVLTGLPNRVNFSNHLHQFIAVSQRSKGPFTVLLLDLDRFKQVNDKFGHHTGDLLLKEVAARISSSLRETDFVARLGGDEFVVIQRDGPQPAAVEALARRLIGELGGTYLIDGHDVICGTSIGISSYPKDGNNSVELLKKADLALYRAKSHGKGTFQFYTSELSSESASKKDREDALRDGLKNHQFELYYQPQIDMNNWRISNVEALLRWHPTDLELLLPGDFLAAAEETGIIVEIGEWALRQACGQVRKWQGMGLTALRLSLNCSARQFGDPKFMSMIPPILSETGFAADCLELEISESMLARHPEIRDQLHAMRVQGVRITVDNFGTGTIPLIDLKDLEIDVLKIDKEFIQHLPHRREDSAITSAIISLAHDLGIGVAAGGVETAEQLAYLKARDCMNVQGFIFSPPIPAEKFEQLMMSGHWSRINRLPALDEATVFKDLH